MEGSGHLCQESNTFPEIFSGLTPMSPWAALVKWPPQQQGTPGKFFKLEALFPQTKYISKEEERKCKLVKQLAMSATNISTTKITIMESLFSQCFD